MAKPVVAFCFERTCRVRELSRVFGLWVFGYLAWRGDLVAAAMLRVGSLSDFPWLSCGKIAKVIIQTSPTARLVQPIWPWPSLFTRDSRWYDLRWIDNHDCGNDASVRSPRPDIPRTH